MDYSGLTYTLINDVNREGRSAWLASGLHRAAWAIEPLPLALTGTSHGDLRHCEGARS